MTSTTTAEVRTARPSLSPSRGLAWVLPLLRVAMGVVFFWPFLDKLFGLGFATTPDAAWINGGSPTSGFLEHGVQGPFAPTLAALAGSVVVDWLFMLGMAGVGVALILGVAVRISTASGIALMVILKIAVWENPNNPILDEHIIYGIVLLALAAIPASRAVSLNHWWERLPIVRRVPLLK